MARGLCRPRLRSAGFSVISIRMASSMRARPSGGKSDVEGKVAPDDFNGLDEGQGVGITARTLAGLDHQLADGEVGEQKTVDLLSDQGASAGSVVRLASSP
jgi:hypothetical protein